MIFRSVNPTSELVVGEFASHSHKEVDARIAFAQTVQREWSKRSVADRSIVLRNVAQVLTRNADSIAPYITQEMGKPIAQSVAEIVKSATVCEFMADVAPRILRDTYVPSSFASSIVRYESLGLVLCIMPWNFPFWQFFRFAAPALIAGNGILLKHAPSTFGCAEHIVRICVEGGIPEGLVQNVMVDVPDVERIVANTSVRAVTFTGSTQGGRAVGALAGRYVKKSVLELGGSDAYIVLDDTDVERAAMICANARCTNGGQSCISAKRFIVHESIATEFTQQLINNMHAKSVGDPMTDVDVGPLARKDLRENLLRQFDAAVSEGAIPSRALIPSDIQKGWFVQPVVISNVVKGSTADAEELFGPVAAVITVASDAEALAVANGSAYGLGASVFTSNSTRAQEFVSQLECGTVFVNDFVRSDARLPFGGVKDSGYGRELGVQGLTEFVNIKTVVEA